jgi:hypothetical protein
MENYVHAEDADADAGDSLSDHGTILESSRSTYDHDSCAGSSCSGDLADVSSAAPQ